MVMVSPFALSWHAVSYLPTRTPGVNREVLQSEIRMQIFVELGLRTHESSDGPANRRIVLQTEN